ncbi:hypothetical protein [Legionella brunensis]|uniref:C-type lysozyme inhibitor domain-containing protein n=1 Tax=Legionella brunensis TaxID=29422 RepID=A0A0W0SU24_9GAMM|nr:hypothetical protein [Legionella brunensis]KTC86453.1 hypothetical protein Lbru_0394 [Legionella brunensis]
MKIWFAVVFSLTQVTFAYAQRTVVCTMQGLKDNLSFVAPQKMGELPSISFAYPVDTTIFSMREGNLLLVAMDHEDKSRPRIMISAQANKNSPVYKGQFMTDFGGNQIQLDNGPVSCKLK